MLNKMINLDLSGKKITIVLLLLLVTVGVWADMIYVSNDGNDNNPGTQEEPFEHIQYAIDSVGADDRLTDIIVMNGIYHENLIIAPVGRDPRPIRSIQSESCDPTLCIIDAIDVGLGNSVIMFNGHSYEIPLTLNGFTVTHSNEDNMLGIYIGESIINLINCIIRNNSYAGIYYGSLLPLKIINCDIISNDGLGAYSLQNTAIINSVFWGNNNGNEQLSGEFIVNYSNIQGGWEGEGNTDTDPLLDDNFQPIWTEDVKSPCIDTGDPNSSLNADGTPADMGAIPAIDHDYEKIDLLKWKWLCFPVLDNLYQFGDVASYMLTDILDENSYFMSDLETALWREFNDLPTEDQAIKWYNEDGWSNLRHEFTPTQGYKFKIQTPIITNMEMSGWLAPPDTSFPFLAGGREQWMGYFLKERLFCHEAFGYNWSNVHKIKAQEWSYVADAPGPSHRIRPIEYGKMYIVTFYEDVNNFQWNTDIGAEPVEAFVRLEPQYFTYEEKANYEVIDVLDIPEDVVEIGVYQDDRCVGAVVTDEDAEQILVYSDRMNRDETVFTFQLVYGRSGAVPLNNYTVYDEKVGDYVKGNIVAGKQDYSIIRFEGGEPTDPPQVMQLLGNFPNPFTGETTINFSLSAENMKNAEIEIFNIKGQKVENLQITNSPNQQIIWNANNFANGVYFYKLVVDGIAVDTKKMILLK